MLSVQNTKFEFPDPFGNFVHHLLLYRFRPRCGVLHFDECYRERGIEISWLMRQEDFNLVRIGLGSVDRSLNDIPAFVA